MPRWSPNDGLMATHRGTVLVVDDDPVNLRLLSDILADEPFEVTFAADGQMALDQVRITSPDLILLDAQMPVMDGFEVCARLKADPETANITILFMTGLTDSASRRRGFELGAVDYLTKPVERDELTARLHTHIALRRALRELHEKNLALERELAERIRAERQRANLQQQIIEAQQSRLLELSTPIIPISDRILVMPLIGTMDEKRAEHVRAQALARASRSRADVMIFDITGMTQVDREFARAIVGTVRALRLLGTRTFLTGIQAELAQALIAQDVDLREIVTPATLQTGIAMAMAEN